MPFVTPSVHLVQRPVIDWLSLAQYIEEIGGDDWLARILATKEPGDNQGMGDGQILAEIGGRLCYRSWTPGLNPNVTKVREDSDAYLANILSSGHGSVLEHVNYGFIFHNVSRVFTHELVRHRAGAAVSQESLRYVRLDDIPFWLPEWAQQDQTLVGRVAELLAHMEEFQSWSAEHFGLDDEGVPFHEKKAKTSFMRRLAPNGLTTGLLWTANVRTLRHVIETRTAPGAEEEIRMVFSGVAVMMIQEAPALFGDFEAVLDPYKQHVASWKPAFPKV